MKTTKRFLATIVAVMLVLTSITVPSFAATFTDLSEKSASYTAVNVLNMLGIINGYDDGNGNFSFKPDNNVTRAEFTAMLLRTRGMGSMGSTSLDNPPFPDVTTPDVSWAIGNIRTARELGIINGYDDGTFKPNNNVSYEEAIKMIVCALGYGEMGTDGAFWYSRYLVTATSLGFTQGAGGAISVPATRATIATMLYNCLEIKLAENNEITEKTILENDLKLTKNVGYIASNPDISLFEPESSSRSNEIQIIAPDKDGDEVVTTFKVDNADKYNDMLGSQITFYYTTDRNTEAKTLISATVTASETLEIESSLVDDYTDSSIEYYRDADSTRTNTAKIASDSVVVYNGKLFGNDPEDSTFKEYCETVEDPMPSIGSIKLLDRDGDKKYDVVFIDSYTAWVVSSATSSNRTITDNVLRTSGKLKLEESTEVKIVDEKGNELSFSSIKKGNVVSVKEDAHGGVTAVVTTKTVSGKITGTSSKKGYTISGKDYKSSRQAPWGSDAADSSKMAAPEYGDSGKFYLDIDGNIIAYDKTETSVTQYYGLITKAAVKISSGFDETLRVNILTKSNPSGKNYNITTKTRINDKKYDDLEEALEDGLGGDIMQGVKFTLDGTDIDEIITAEAQDAAMTVETDKLYVFETDDIDKDTEWTYSTSGKELKAEGESIYIGSAQIISVVDDKYKNMTTSNFSSGTKYKVQLFDVTGSNSAKYVVVYEGSTTSTAAMAEYPVMVITEVLGDTVDGEDVTILNGYVGKTAKNNVMLSTTDVETGDVADTLKPGDVVRLGVDDEDSSYYTIKEDHLIFSLADGYRDIAVEQPEGTKASDSYPKTEKNNSSRVTYRVLWGSAYSIDDEGDGNRFIVSNEILAADDDTDDTETFEKSEFSGAQIYRYDADEKELVPVDEDYLSALEGLIFANSGAKPSEIFIHMTSDSKVATLIILDPIQD